MTHSYHSQQEKRRQASEQYMVSRAARNLGVPPSSSGISKSILDWINTLLRMDANHDSLPDPPTGSELKSMKEYHSNKKTTISREINDSLTNHSCLNSTSRVQQLAQSLVRRDAIRQINYSQVQAPASSSITPTSLIQKHDDMWVQNARTLILNSGIPRLTYHWEQSPTSPWNSSVTAILLKTWTQCHEGGGTATYSIDERHNQPDIILAIINWWLNSRRAVWKKNNTNKCSSSKQKKTLSSTQKINKQKVQ